MDESASRKKYEIVDFEEGEGGRKAPRLNYDDFRVESQMTELSRGRDA